LDGAAEAPATPVAPRMPPSSPARLLPFFLEATFSQHSDIPNVSSNRSTGSLRLPSNQPEKCNRDIYDACYAVPTASTRFLLLPSAFSRVTFSGFVPVRNVG